MLISTAYASTAYADDPAEYEFDVDAQPTDGSLIEIAETSDTQVLFSPDAVDRNWSREVRGTKTVDSALNTSLQDSDLKYEFKSEDFVVVTEKNPAPSSGQGIDRGPVPELLMAQLQDDRTQEQATDLIEVERDDPGAPETRAIDEIVVTSTQTGTGIRGVAPVGSQTLTISREELQLSPVRNAAEIIRDLPQGSQLGTNIAEDQDNGRAPGVRGINLRGLGGNTTLLLLDGHRIVGQGVSIIKPDPSIIPFAAIERVDVVLDGASSVYGSDAVAGVVNYIMRDDFEGVDVQISGQDGLYDTGKIDLVAGHAWQSANLMVGLSKEYRSDVEGNARGYFMQDLRPYGGNDNRVLGSSPTPGPNGLIRAGSTVFGIPASWTGESTGYPNPDGSGDLFRPTLAEILATEPEFADESDYRKYQGSVDQRSAFLRFSVDLSDTLQVIYSGMASWRDSESQRFGTVDLQVTPNSPYWIPGLTTGSSYTIWTSPNEQGLRWYANGESRTQNHFVDVRRDIGKWQMTASAFWGETKGSDIDEPERNNAAIVHNPTGTPDGYKNYMEIGIDGSGIPRGGNPEWYNPYLQTTFQEAYHTKLTGHTLRWGELQTYGANIRFEGPLMETPGGTLRGSVGAEYIDSWHWMWLPQTVRFYPDSNGNLQSYDFRNTEYDREVSSVFAEIYWPLVGDSNARPGIQRLAVSASVRLDDYSDFFDTTNPRLGVVWDVNDDLSFRASYGTAFLAPTLEQINPGVIGSLRTTGINVDPAVLDADIPFIDPANNRTDVYRIHGRNPSLGPETATMWSVGFDYTPVQVAGLDVRFTYYTIEYEDKIEALPGWQGAFLSAENRQLYDPFIHKFMQPSTCMDGILSSYSPELLKWAEGIALLAGGAGDCAIGALIDLRLQNIGSVYQDGIDTQVSYEWESNFGHWRASVNLAKILKLERTLLTSEWFDVLDRIGWQTSTRANLRLGWMRNNWSAALTGKFDGSYTNDQPITVGGVQQPVSKVPSWTTWDFITTYTTPERGTMLDNIRVFLGVQNLTDKDPPIVLHGSVAWDSSVHNPFGRIWSLEVGKRF